MAAKKTAKSKPESAAKTAKGAVAGSSGSNRRRFQRRDTKIAARLEHDGKPVDGVVTNLSLQGCLFSPRVPLKPGTRIKLRLANESKAVTATVKAVSDQGVHCLLHAGGATLGRLSADLDDMALLMLSAGRPHEVLPATGAQKPAKRRAAR